MEEHAPRDLPPPDSHLIRVTVLPHPFQSQRWTSEVPAGGTVREVLAAAGVPKVPAAQLRVMVDGVAALGDELDELRPEALVTCRVIPAGIEAALIAALLAVASAAASVTGAGAIGGFLLSGLAGLGLVGGGALGVAAITAGVFVGSAALVIGATSLAINAAINALVPTPSTPRSFGGPQTSPTLAGARNAFYRFEPVWRVYGKHRVTLPLAGETFVEPFGGITHLRMLLTAGIGPVELSSFRIGKDAITAFEDVELEWADGAGNFWRELPGPKTSIAGLTLYTNAVDVTNVGVEVSIPADFVTPGEWLTRTSNAEGDEAFLDLTFPRGIFWIDQRRGPSAVGQHFQVQLRKVGNVPWLTVGASIADHVPLAQPFDAGIETVAPGAGIAFHPVNTTGVYALGLTAFSQESTARSLRIVLPERGIFEFRIRRLTPHFLPNVFDNMFLGAIRMVTKTNPVTLAGVSLVSLRIRSSDQLSGIIDSLNCLVEAKLPGLDANGNLTAAAITRNPAWAYLDVLRGGASPRPIALSKIDTARISELAAFCEPTPGTYVHTFDGVFDFKTTKLDAARRILSVARSSIHVRDGKFSCVIDRAQTAVANLVTPRNSIGLRGQKRFVETPHALRVEFKNEAQDYEDDERIVYDDGFTAANATRFETLRLFGITNTDRAWKAARYHIADHRLRTEIWEVEMDPEYLVAERGDRIEITHEVPLIGLGFGRFKSVVLDSDPPTDPTTVTGGTVDQPLTFEASKSYQLRIRTKAGTILLASVVNPATTVPVETTTVTFTTAQTQPSAPDAGDLFEFGETGLVSEAAIVKEVHPKDDLGARLVLIPYAAGVYSADSGAIPPHVPVISLSPWEKPPRPRVLGFRTSGADLVVTIAFEPPTRAEAARVQLQYRTAFPVGAWIGVPVVEGTTRELRVPGLVDGFLYDIRLRSLTATSIPSDWLTTGVRFETDAEILPVEPADPGGPRFRITGLEVANSPNGTEFLGPDAHFDWRLNDRELLDPLTAPIDASFEGDYVVRIFDGLVGGTLRTEPVLERRYAYTFARNHEDASRAAVLPRRSVGIGVRYRHPTLGLSDESSIIVTNPAPGVPPALALGAVPGGARITFSRPADSDFLGVVVCMSQSPGFTPSLANQVADAAAGPIVIPRVSGTWYACVAAYDAFAKGPVAGVVDYSLLQFSAELSVVVAGVNTADLVPGAATTLHTFVKSSGFATLDTNTETETYGPVTIDVPDADTIVDPRVIFEFDFSSAWGASSTTNRLLIELLRRPFGGGDTVIDDAPIDFKSTVPTAGGGTARTTVPSFTSFNQPGAGVWDYRLRLTTLIAGSGAALSITGVDLNMEFWASKR